MLLCLCSWLVYLCMCVIMYRWMILVGIGGDMYVIDYQECVTVVGGGVWVVTIEHG